MTRTKYTLEQRTEALKLYAEAGPAEASRRTGSKRGTISKWASRDGVSSDRAERTRKATEAARQSYAEGRARRSAALAQEADALIERLKDASPLNAGHLSRAIHLLIHDAAFEANQSDAQTERKYPSPEEFDREVEELNKLIYEETLEYVRRELRLKEIPEHIREAVLAGRAKEVTRVPPPPEQTTPSRPIDPVEEPQASRRNDARRSPSPPPPEPVPAPTGSSMFEAADFIRITIQPGRCFPTQPVSVQSCRFGDRDLITRQRASLPWACLAVPGSRPTHIIFEQVGLDGPQCNPFATERCRTGRIWGYSGSRKSARNAN